MSTSSTCLVINMTSMKKYICQLSFYFKKLTFTLPKIKKNVLTKMSIFKLANQKIFFFVFSNLKNAITILNIFKLLLSIFLIITLVFYTLKLSYLAS